eukprot:268719-Rhodomonas_salina.7
MEGAAYGRLRAASSMSEPGIDEREGCLRVVLVTHAQCQAFKTRIACSKTHHDTICDVGTGPGHDKAYVCRAIAAGVPASQQHCRPHPGPGRTIQQLSAGSYIAPCKMAELHMPELQHHTLFQLLASPRLHVRA